MYVCVLCNVYLQSYGSRLEKKRTSQQHKCRSQNIKNSEENIELNPIQIKREPKHKQIARLKWNRTNIPNNMRVKTFFILGAVGENKLIFFYGNGKFDSNE